MTRQESGVIIKGGLVAVTISFAIWDRRSVIEPVKKAAKGVEKKCDTIEEALKSYAAQEPRLADILKTLGIM